MSATVLVGMQWGDEGKGKIIDFLAEAGMYHYIVRFQGGPNAGHTVVVDGKETILHSLPSGILHPKLTNVCGNGVVINLETLCKEMDELAKSGITFDNLKLSRRAHIIMPYHRMRGDIGNTSEKIGTTKRGIGPCYTDKVTRIGVRLCDMLDGSGIHDIRHGVREYNKLSQTPLDEDQVVAEQSALFNRISRYVTDTSLLIDQALRAKKGVLLEGAQGTMLDVDHGTYPYVTSSNTVASAACTGAGIGPLAIRDVVGILKAYTTRVGEGPLPTELKDETGERLVKNGGEYGATTGRKRRCGWLDLVQARYSVRVNSITDLVITKLDVLDSESEIKVCNGYVKGNESTSEMPEDLQGWEPTYETLPGWNKPTAACREFKDLPKDAKSYVAYISKKLGVPIRMISVGKDREQTILV